MPLYELDGLRPRFADPTRVYVARGAQVIGEAALPINVDAGNNV